MKSIQKKVAETFDAHPNRYSDIVNKSISFSGLNVDFFTKVKAEYLIAVAKNHYGATEKLKVLDVGCGVGNYHDLLRPRFAALHGVDVSVASVDQAAANHPSVIYKTYDGYGLPYEDGCFDLVYTICVMHHVPQANRANFLKEMHRVVRPQGLALVFEHNPWNLLTVKAVKNCPFDEDAVLLRSSELTKLMVYAGFQDVESKFIIAVPPINSMLMKIDRAFCRIPLGAQYYVVAKRG